MNNLSVKRIFYAVSKVNSRIAIYFRLAEKSFDRAMNKKTGFNTGFLLCYFLM